MSEAEDLLCHLQSLARRYRRQLGPELAADLAAEALVRALRRPPPDGRFGPWLERILHNLVVDHWRRAARPLEAPAPETPATPEDLALARERRRHLERSLARLSPEVRRSLLHRYGEGGGPRERAASTGRTRVHRGLCRLRELMKGLASFLPPFGQGALAAQAAVVTVFLAQQSPAPPPPAPRPTAHAPAPRAHTPPAPREPADAPAASAPQPKPPAPRRYDFDDDEVVGDLQRPLEELVVAPARPAHHPSLIEIPDSFTANVIKSVEDL
jgi:RNA polymerase sigma factor (sigma-70 family)